MLDKKLINLKNGVQALLVSDPKANKTSCAIDVRTGSMNDPLGHQGLSHLVEHMIFKGSARHEDGNLLSSLLYANQGVYSAVTGPEHSSFCFESGNAAFKQCLDVFSSIFEAPLFSKEYIKGEVSLIDSEFSINKNDADTLCRHIINSVGVVKGHPISKFFHGNAKTLKGVTSDELKSFFKLYSPSCTKLAVCGRASLAELEELVLINFTSLKGDVKGPSIFSGPVFDKAMLPDVIHVGSRGGKPFLRICFEAESMYGRYRSKPNWILSSLINSERKGSVISVLREKGLADELWASFQNLSFASFLNIDVMLSSKGLMRPVEVSKYILSYFDLLNKEGYKDHIYEEQKATSEAGFRFKEHKEGYLYVKGLARSMHYYEPVYCEEQSELIYEHGRDEFLSLLDELKPEHSRLVVYGSMNETDKKDKYYGAKFSRAVNKKIKDLSAYGKGLSYPGPNLFISSDFTHIADDRLHFPRKIMDSERGVVWYLQDWELGLPHVYINLLLLSNTVNAGPKQKLSSILYCKFLNEMLRDISDMAGEAGLSFGIDRSDKGLAMYFAGYSEKIPVLFQEFVKLLGLKVDDDTALDKVKRSLKADYRELERSSSYSIAQYYRYDLMHSQNINYLEYKDLVDRISLQDLELIRKDILRELAVESYVYGNISSKDAMGLVDILFDQLGSSPLPLVRRPKDLIVKLPRPASFSFTENCAADDSSWTSYYDLGRRHIRLSAIVQLGFGFLKGFFFDQMRNKRKLAYIVESRLDFFEHVLGISFAVCSDKYGPFKLSFEAEEVFREFIPYLEGLSEEELCSSRASLIAGISKYNRTIEEWMSELVLTAAVKGDPDYGKKLCAEISTVTREELCETFSACLVGDRKAALNVHVGHNIKKVPKGRGFNVIEDISLYKRTTDTYQ